MSSVIYYSNYCEHSKKLLLTLSKSENNKNIHFICIDKRTIEPDGKTYIILETGQKLILPNTITQVPALMLMTENFKVLFGDNIYNYLQPIKQEEVRVATNNNFEPECFSFGSSGAIVSDQYSFLDADTSAQGNGGLSQLHKYVTIDYQDQINNIPQEESVKAGKLSENITIEMLDKQRRQDEAGFLGR
jgi:hypothetical protein